MILTKPIIETTKNDKSNKNRFSMERYENMEADQLIEVIKNEYHKYISITLKYLFQYSKELASLNQLTLPKLTGISEDILILKNYTLTYIKEKENILFPFLKKMLFYLSNKNYDLLPFNTTKYTIEKFKHSSDTIISKINYIINTVHRFSNKNDIYTFCFLLSELLQKMEILRNIEDEILFLRIISTEDSLLKKKYGNG